MVPPDHQRVPIRHRVLAAPCHGCGPAFFGLVAGALMLANRDRRAGHKAWATASSVVAVTIFVFFGLSGGGPSGQLLFPAVSGLLQRISLVAGLGWVAVIAARHLRDTARSGVRHQ